MIHIMLVALLQVRMDRMQSSQSKTQVPEDEVPMQGATSAWFPSIYSVAFLTLFSVHFFGEGA